MKSYIPKSSEDAEQEVVIEWARLSEGKWPELALLHHIPNGGSRDIREAKKLQRMGVRAGVADLHLPVARGPWHGLYIEMKYDDGRLRKAQKGFLKLAAEQGVYCVACFTAEDAIGVIRQYVSRDTKYPNLSILRGGKIIGTIE
jgi:hypothetical protein